MPKGISNLQMLDQNCANCLKKTGREVKLFNLEFEAVLVNEVMAQVLPLQDNTAGKFCLMPCDS